MVQQGADCAPFNDNPDEIVTEGDWEVAVYSDVTTLSAMTSVLTWYENLTPRDRDDLKLFNS